jgi:hypothetical protein
MVALARLILILAFVIAFAMFVAARYVKTHAGPGITAARILSEALHRQAIKDWREETHRARAHLKQLRCRGQARL